jgi:glycolate oxidase iron-sulfur subunit
VNEEVRLTPETAYDAADFKSLAPLEPLIDKCVHCGFCLPACPSYILLGQEMDSPRGRIYMMKAGVEGRMPMNDGMVGHFDTCLGCMACETACPSGVRYAPLVEETRAAIEHHHARPVGERLFRQMLFWLLPYPSRLRLFAAPLKFANALRARPRLLSLLPPKLRNLIALAPDASRAAAAGMVPERTAASGSTRLRVGFVTGCVQQVFFSHVNEATVRVLAAEGCEVLAPRSQGCCGALALHSGRDGDARTFARALIETFERPGADAVDVVVVNAAGCGSSMKSYGELFRDDPAWAARAQAFAAKVRDVTEVLAGFGTARAPRNRLDMRIAYHDACHLAHAQGIRQQPRDLLAAIPGVTLVPLAESDICCGSAGIFNLVQPEMAATLGARKAANIADAKPDIVATTNPGCMLQISASARAAGVDQPIVHVVEVLDASIRGKAL